MTTAHPTQSPLSSSEFVATTIDNGRVSTQQIWLVLICLILNMLDGFDITAMAVTAKGVGAELGIGADKLGLVFSASLAGMMIGAMFLAALSDLFGRRNIILTSIIVIATTVLMTASANSLWQLTTLRFLSGLGAGAMLASQATLASEYSSAKFRALAVTAVTAGYPLGAMMTGIVGNIIVPEYGWRGMFLFGGSLTFLMFFVALVMIPESLQFLLERRPPNALQKANKILSKLKKNQLHELPTIAETESSDLITNLRKLLSSAFRLQTLTLWLSFFLCFSTLYFLMSWIPKLIEDAGFSAQVGREAFTLFNLGGVIGIFLLGFISTRLKLSNLVSVFLVTSGIAMVVFAKLPAEKYLLLAIIFLIGVLQQGGFTGLYGIATKIYPSNFRSTGVGWAIGLGRAGAVIGPYVAGLMIAEGVTMSGNFIVFAVPMVIGGLIAFWLHVK